MIIKNAVVNTMADQEYDCGFIQFDQGKILAVGPMEACPQDDEACFDAQGGVVLPGLIDAHCHVGMWEEGNGFEGDDGNEESDPCTPHLRAVDGIKIDRAFEEAAMAGITTIVTGPGSANPIAGQMCALKTVGHCVDRMLLKAPLAMKLALGENPKTTYHDKQAGPVTRMGIAALVREQLAKAKKYLEQIERAKEDEDLEEPEYDAKCEALLPLLRREIKAHFHAHLPEDIFTALRIGAEFGLDCVIVHGTGGYVAAQELAQAGIGVITGPLIGARTKPELACARVDTPAVLCREGVPVAICTDHPEVPIRHLLLSAKLAVEAGMPKADALRAITVIPAALCGLSDRLGTLEPGKDADMVLYAKDPMESAANQPVAVWIDGVRVPFRDQWR